ncbi:ATP-grasp fold amidoligase family protein [Vibrio kanaloae]|nr:ATP-grasp fold amidoligase family protein [Vibrio kanaloae]
MKYLTRDILRLILGVRVYTFFRFIFTHKYIPNLSNPRSFSEKIIYRKFNTPPESFSKFVDKYTVREFIKERIGQDYLIPLLKKTDTITREDFIDLPNSFVMKTSNGGGGENVLLVEDKSKLNLDDLCIQFNRYLKIKVGHIVDEHFYDIEKPKVIFEKLIKHKDGRYPSDYKVHVFNGDRADVIIQIDSDRFGNHKRSLFDDNLNRLDFNIQPKYAPVPRDYDFPSNMNELIDVAKKLSSQFKYVRVDLYNVDGKVYFGELTFCHGSGWEPLSTKDADFYLGSLWKEFNDL